MVGLSSGTLPTRVQILVLTPFPAFSRIYQRYALGGKVLIGGRVCVVLCNLEKKQLITKMRPNLYLNFPGCCT
jgi:hypothetical protein